MSTLIFAIFVGVISIVGVMGLGLAGGICFYYYVEAQNRNQNNFESNKIANRKIPTGLRQSDIGSGIKQTKVSITNASSSINTRKSKKQM